MMHNVRAANKFPVFTEGYRVSPKGFAAVRLDVPEDLPRRNEEPILLVTP